MTVFTYIGENIDRIKKDVRIGITSYCVIKHWAIYSRYDYYKKTGYSSAESVFCAGQDYKISDVWVYNIIKKMEVEL